MNVKSCVIKIDENGITNTISIDRATLVPTKDHGTIRTTSNLDPSTRTTVLKNIDTERDGPPKYEVERVVDHGPIQRTESTGYTVMGYPRRRQL